MDYPLKKQKEDLLLVNNSKQFSTCIGQKKPYDILDRYDKKRYAAKIKKLREDLIIGEEVLVLVFAERIKKKAAPSKFHKQSVQNISYFNKDRTFIIRKKQSIDKIKYYWLTDAQNNKKSYKKIPKNCVICYQAQFCYGIAYFIMIIHCCKKQNVLLIVEM